MFGVHVEDVKTMNFKGKITRWGQRTYQRSDWKKAIVTLKKGEAIDFIEGV
jgi:large subunit ribosomal protein L23